MSIIAARRYAHGKPKKDPLVIDGATRALPTGMQFDWVGLSDPTAQ